MPTSNPACRTRETKCELKTQLLLLVTHSENKKLYTEQGRSKTHWKPWTTEQRSVEHRGRTQQKTRGDSDNEHTPDDNRTGNMWETQWEQSRNYKTKEIKLRTKHMNQETIKTNKLDQEKDSNIQTWHSKTTMETGLRDMQQYAAGSTKCILITAWKYVVCCMKIKINRRWINFCIR